MFLIHTELRCTVNHTSDLWNKFLTADPQVLDATMQNLCISGIIFFITVSSMAPFYGHAISLKAMIWQWLMKQISFLYKKACDLFGWSSYVSWMWEIVKSFSHPLHRCGESKMTVYYIRSHKFCFLLTYKLPLYCRRLVVYHLLHMDD